MDTYVEKVGKGRRAGEWFIRFTSSDGKPFMCALSNDCMRRLLALLGKTDPKELEGISSSESNITFLFEEKMIFAFALKTIEGFFSPDISSLHPESFRVQRVASYAENTTALELRTSTGESYAYYIKDDVGDSLRKALGLDALVQLASNNDIILKSSESGKSLICIVLVSMHKLPFLLDDF